MKFEFSAGGVVFKKEDNKTFILIARHSYHHGWVFPKGLIGPSTSSGQADKLETKEETATREVEEETGIKASILKPLKPVSYWYVFEKQKIKKTVYYFLMEYVSGNTSKHDMEMEQVEWLPKGEVENRLTYRSDKKVWQEARELMADSE